LSLIIFGDEEEEETDKDTLLSEEELPADFLGIFRTRHRVPLGARICRQRRTRKGSRCSCRRQRA
jgi:hypothetical protein